MPKVKKKQLKVLVGCEFSGIVRDEFIKLGHKAVSCDLLPSETPGPHLQQDLLEVLHLGWDMLIAFPPCTHLTIACGHLWAEKQKAGLQGEAIDFVKKLMLAPIPMIAIENPLGILSSAIRPPDQIIQPYEFGHEAQKTTCLWLKNLPALKPTKIVMKGDFKYWVDKKTGKQKKYPMWLYNAYAHTKPKDRWKVRSTTFKGIAEAMAKQWTKPGIIQGKLF
jgi:site-specific DNA-cytosine methylase